MCKDFGHAPILVGYVTSIAPFLCLLCDLGLTVAFVVSFVISLKPCQRLLGDLAMVDEVRFFQSGQQSSEEAFSGICV
jgi:hypothetical protein